MQSLPQWFACRPRQGTRLPRRRAPLEQALGQAAARIKGNVKAPVCGHHMQVNRRSAIAASAKHTRKPRAVSLVCPQAGQSGQAHSQWQAVNKGGSDKETAGASMPATDQR